MVFVMSKTERTESAIHTVQAVHITLTFVRISMKLTLNKELLTQKRLQPWRPSIKIFIIRATSALIERCPENRETEQTSIQIFFFKKKNPHSGQISQRNTKLSKWATQKRIKDKKLYHDSSVLRLDFPNRGFVVFDRQLEEQGKN